MQTPVCFPLFCVEAGSAPPVLIQGAGEVEMSPLIAFLCLCRFGLLLEIQASGQMCAGS